MSEKRVVYAEDVIQRIRDLAHGKPYGCATPWLIAWLGSLHGVVYVPRAATTSPR